MSSHATLGIAGTHPEGSLFAPDDAANTPTHHFMERVNAKHGMTLKNYFDLYSWSTSEIDKFWGDVWDFTGVVGHKGSHVVDTAAAPPHNPTWFAEARLNWAENMLRCRSPAKTALVEASEFAFCSFGCGRGG